MILESLRASPEAKDVLNTQPWTKLKKMIARR
jgi:hypothetical protein